MYRDVRCQAAVAPGPRLAMNNPVSEPVVTQPCQCWRCDIGARGHGISSQDALSL